MTTNTPLFFALPHLPGPCLDALALAGIRTLGDLIAWEHPLEYSVLGLTAAMADRIEAELSRVMTEVRR